MSTYKSLVVLGIVVLLLAACVPTAIPQADVMIETPAVLDSPTATTSANPTPIAVATSRGPNLEATDPATVQLASGGLQLVEFFRFT